MKSICPICQKSDKLILKDKMLNMYECTACGHAFSLIDEKSRVSYVDNYYDSTHAQWFKNPNHWLFKYIHSNLKRLMKKEDVKLLDAGCGKGDFLKFIKKIDPHIEPYGIDLCDNNFTDIHFTKADFLSAPYDDKMDCVCSIAVIEHIDDLSSFLKKVRSVLLPGGIVTITTDNTRGIVYRIARALKKINIKTPFYSLYEPAHLHHFTNRSLRMLVEQNGFKVVSQRNHNYPVRAVNFPKSNMLMGILYRFGIAIFFSLPKRIGILQTVICVDANQGDRS